MIKRKVKYFNMIFQLKSYCTQHDCNTCPLLDREADCCYLHSTCPEDWDSERIKEALEHGDSGEN